VFVFDASGTVRHREATAIPGVEPDYSKVHATLAQL
jgi:hypothetical protein